MVKFETKILETDKIAHHKIASIHRKMSEREFISLKLSIQEVGQLEPIKLFKNKLVDGRHRQRALSELGIQDIKVEILPNNLSLKQVKDIAIGTEMRRADNVAQKAIRAYRWYQENADTATREEAGIKFAIDRKEVGRVEKLEARVGSDMIDRLYKDGKVFIGGKRYSTLRTIIKALDATFREEEDVEPMSDLLKQGFDVIQALYDSEDSIGLARLSTRLKNVRTKEI